MRLFRSHPPCEKKHKFSTRIQPWKLRDPATASHFQSAFKVKTMTAAAAIDNAYGADADTTNGVKSARSKLKFPLRNATTEVCGLAKNLLKPETWSCIDQLDKTVTAKRARFKVYSDLKKTGMAVEAKEAKTVYIDANCVAKHTIWLAKSEAEKEEFATVSPEGGYVFRIVKQMDRTKQDSVVENFVRNDAGELVLTVKSRMKAWVEPHARLPNVEFEWPSKDLHEVLLTAGQHVHSPDPQSTKQKEMQQGCWSIWYRSPTPVCHGSFSMMKTWCSSGTPKRSVSPNWRRGRLAWNVNASVSTCRRPGPWPLVKVMKSDKCPVLSAVVASAEIPSCAHCVCYGSTRLAVA